MIESTPALTVGLALAAGVIAQVVARHILMPGIVVLLVAGVLLGPDVANVIQPGQLGRALQVLVGFAVAIILFEGGMNLDIRRLRAEALAIRRLVTYGAVISGVGATLATRFIMGWDWRLSAVFGALMIVTGPTVVTPLVRRLRLKEPVSTILVAEGVLIDPIGALIAVVTLELLFAENTTLAASAQTAAIVLGIGAIVGLVGGIATGYLLRRRHLVPEGMENILVLGFAVAIFQISESIHHDSGLTSVVVAGMVVGNMQSRARRELFEFKEQLTVLMIGLLFVLLAADVRLGQVIALGWPAVLTVLALMLIVRPVQAYLCTVGSSLSTRERTFLASLAPRGIVAAAIASLFAQQLVERGVAEGAALQAMAFVVIAMTVTIHGLTGGVIAEALGVRRRAGNGYVILGANALGRTYAGILGGDGHEIVLVDNNAERVMIARGQGLEAIHGQGLQSSVLEAVDVDSRIGCLAVTANEEVNLLFVTKIREETRVPELYVALRRELGGIPPENVHAAGAFVLFGRSRRLEAWNQRFDEGTAHVERWTRTAAPATAADGDEPILASEAVLVMAVRRKNRLGPFHDDITLGAKEEIVVGLADERRDEGESLLRDNGWSPMREEASAVRA